MKEIWQYIVENWQWILSVLTAVIVFIIQLFKKRPKAYSFLDYVYELAQRVPALVCEAEKLFGNGNGDKKKSYVIERLLNSLKLVCVLNERCESNARHIFDVMVEDVLKTPQKKGN